MEEKKRFIVIGFSLILVSAFFDNIRGPVLPLFTSLYGLSHSQSSAFFWVASVSAFLISISSVRLLARWSERAYIQFCLAIQAAAILFASAGGYAALLLSGAAWGAGNSGIGMSSNLVLLRGSTDKDRPRLMSALHLFYGIGSVLPASYVAATADRWSPQGIVLPTLVLVVLLAVLSFQLPASGEHAQPSMGMPWRDMFRPHPLACNLVISAYVLGEVLNSMWLVTYLNSHAGLSVPEASRFQQLYFLSLAASRVLGAFLLKPGMEDRLPVPLMLASAAGLGAGLAGWRQGFLLASFCFGPVFPLLGAKLAKDYPDQFSSLLSFTYAVMTVLLALGHVLVGLISDRFSLQAAFVLPSLCLLAAVLLTFVRDRLLPHAPQTPEVRPCTP
ncbi:MAG: hypothetical protein A2X36_10580 [Elusimicrobia bacterium GWA2_69_24]|nr:MAG: hypothetical protein A2X36_10580 [Elusimicrobia bacterium GWA2_69_24]HBL17899.1 hypothetical protein [Elusimicrobiota bacterium]